jgi:hypothetical protein
MHPAPSGRALALPERVASRSKSPRAPPAAPAATAAPRQVGYGISIVTFLGAVHWGLAMGSSAMASPLMARAARESYL